MEKKMDTTIMGYIGTIIRIHSFIPSQTKASKVEAYELTAWARPSGFRISG